MEKLPFCWDLQHICSFKIWHSLSVPQSLAQWYKHHTEQSSLVLTTENIDIHEACKKLQPFAIQSYMYYIITSLRLEPTESPDSLRNFGICKVAPAYSYLHRLYCQCCSWESQWFELFPCWYTCIDSCTVKTIKHLLIISLLRSRF